MIASGCTGPPRLCSHVCVATLTSCQVNIMGHPTSADTLGRFTWWRTLPRNSSCLRAIFFQVENSRTFTFDLGFWGFVHLALCPWASHCSWGYGRQYGLLSPQHLEGAPQTVRRRKAELRKKTVERGQRDGVTRRGEKARG